MFKWQREENWGKKTSPNIQTNQRRNPHRRNRTLDSRDDGETDQTSQVSWQMNDVFLRTKGKFVISIRLATQQEGPDHTILGDKKLQHQILLRGHVRVLFHLLWCPWTKMDWGGLSGDKWTGGCVLNKRTDWKATDDGEMKQVIRLIILIGTYTSKNENVLQLWNKQDGLTLFNKVVNLQIFQKYVLW